MKKRVFVFSAVLLLLVLAGGEAAAQTSEALWFVRYWNNPDQAGTATRTETVGVINYNWGTGSPAGIQADNWSGRWTSTNGGSRTA